MSELKEIYKKIVRLLMERDDSICGICLKEITDVSQCDIDHIIPKSKKGTNHSTNLQVVHMLCNRAKSNKLLPNLQNKPECPEVDALLIHKNVIKKSIRDKNHKDAVKEIERNIELFKKFPTFRCQQEDKSGIIGKVSHGETSIPTPKKKRKALVTTKKAARRRVVTTIVPSTAPMDLYNEFARNGMKNLSYDIILDYFNAYKNHDPHKVQIIEEK